MPTFTLDDIEPMIRPDLEYKGVSYPAALPDDFGLDTEAKLQSLLKQIEILEGKPDNEKKADKLGDMMNIIIQIYFPTLPMSIIRGTPFLKKQEIMAWWGQNCYPLGMSRLRNTISRMRTIQTA